MLIKESSVKYIRDNLASTLDEIVEGKKTIAITKFGKIKAYIVPKDEYEKLNKESISSETESIEAFEAVKGIWKDIVITSDSVEYIRKIRNSSPSKNFKL